MNNIDIILEVFVRIVHPDYFTFIGAEFSFHLMFAEGLMAHEPYYIVCCGL